MTKYIIIGGIIWIALSVIVALVICSVLRASKGDEM